MTSEPGVAHFLPYAGRWSRIPLGGQRVDTLQLKRYVKYESEGGIK